MTELFIKVKIQQEQKLPFVIYCKPNSDRVVGLFQKNDHLYFVENFEESGFVFAPFDSERIPLLPLEESEVFVEKVAVSDYYLTHDVKDDNNIAAKSSYEELVQKGIEEIREGTFQKVVLSRKETIDLEDFDVESTFKKLVAHYPLAFNYCFYHPKIGLWMGATPEQLLKTKEEEIQTVALAGTQLYKGTMDVNWDEKEIHEQQFVTDYIIEGLKEVVKEVTVSSPYTFKAGNIVHIKTDIRARLKNYKNLQQVLKIIHPTPAVCGLPKNAAKKFILANEGYDREYYSGFLGEFNIELATFRTLQSDLFVNLRCMKIAGPAAELFVGCGITIDSIPSKEYQETVNKSLTIKKIV